MKGISVALSLGAVAGSSIASTFGTVSSRIRDLGKDIRSLKREQAAASKLDIAQGRLATLQAQYAEAPNARLKLAVESAKRELVSAQKAAAKYNITLKDSAAVLAQKTAALGKMETALSRQQKLQSNLARRKELEGQILGTVATFATVAVPVKLAIDYESAMADVKKLVDFDAAGIKKLSDGFLELSTRLPMTAEGMAKIAAQGSKLAKTEEELLTFVEDAAKMGVAFDISADEAGEAMAQLRQNLHLSRGGVLGLGDAINNISNNMAAKVSAGDIVKFTSAVSGTASLFKINGEEAAAFGATLISSGKAPEVAARAFNALTGALNGAPQAGKEAQAAFLRLGFTGKEMGELFKQNPQKAIERFMEAVKGSSDPMRDLTNILGSGFADEIALGVNGLDAYRDALKNATDETARAGSMEKEYASRSQTTANALLLLKNAASRLGIILGSTVLPGITAVATAVVAFLEPVAQLASAFPGVTTAVFGVAGGFIAMKLAVMACSYMGTIFSDGMTMGKIALDAMRLSAWRARIEVLKHRAATLYAAVSARVHAAAQAVQNAVMGVARSRFVMSTAAAVRHGVVSTALAAKTGLATAAQWGLNTAMAANPLGLVVVAIGALVAWFASAYTATGSFTGAIQRMWDQFKSVIPAMEVVEAAIMGTVQFVTDLWNGVSLYDAGAKLIGTLFDGLKATWNRVVAWWDTVKGVFDFGTEAASETALPAETVAATQITAAKQMTTAMADSEIADPWGYTPPAAAASGGTAAPASAPKPAISVPSAPAGGMSLQPQISFSLSFNGVPSKDVGEALVGAIRNKESELVSYFEKMLTRIASNQRRLAYDQ